MKEDDEVSVSVSLSLLYAYKEDWKQLSPFRESFGRNILKRPAYEEALMKREKTDVAILCGGQEFPVHSFVLKREKLICHLNEYIYVEDFRNLGNLIYSNSCEPSI